MQVFGHDLVITQALLDHLHKTFPDILPRKQEIAPAEIGFYQGQQSVLDYLETIYEQINNVD